VTTCDDVDVDDDDDDNDLPQQLSDHLRMSRDSNDSGFPHVKLRLVDCCNLKHHQ